MVRPLVGLLSALACGSMAARAAEPLVIFAANRAPLPIFVAANATVDERAAAEELARVIHVMGAPAPAVTVEPAGDGLAPGIYVGATLAARAQGEPLRVAADWFAPAAGEVGPDAIRLTGHRGRLFVEAATPNATPFAAAWLLQKYAGVLWIWPGPDGEIVPLRTSWEVPAELRATREPAFVSRDLFLSGSADDAAWAVRNGLRAHIEFSHALNRVFTAADADAHPEWFAEVRGQRLRPRDAEDHHWQPNLALPAVAVAAGARARAAFAADPSRRSFSLGMNDTVRFDQSAETRELLEPLQWFRGMPDYSPLVFTFMNRAAATLDADEAMRGRYLGSLAYFWCENPPPFPVNPRVIPYLTTDRAQFFDPAYRAAELALLERWGRSGVRTFGLWDYAYGGGFLVPRVPVHALADGIRAGHRAGARGYFADASAPTWGFDAFKLWAISRLLWEPERSADDLADEYFPAVYGPAAKPMREFFARCERRWIEQGGAPFWLKLYEHEDQAGLFPIAECSSLEASLDTALGSVRGDERLQARIRRTVRSFAVTEKLARLAEARAMMSVLEENGVAPDEIMVGGFAFALHRGAQELQEQAARADLRTGLAPFLRNDPVPRWLDALGAADPPAPGRALARFSAHQALPAAWRALAASFTRPAASRARDRSLLRNGDFTKPGEAQVPAFLFPRGGSLPAEWEWRAVATERQAARLVPASSAPHPVLRIEGAWDTQVFQWNPAATGKLYVARVRARGAVGVGSDAGLFLSFLDASGKPVGTHRMQTLPRKSTDQWMNLVLADLAPEGAAWVGVGLAASRQTGADWFEAGSVELRESEEK